jgi:filamentous hemagglutinin family protein
MVEQTQGTAAPRNRTQRRRAALPASVQLVQGPLRARPDLLRSTALQAVFLAGLALPGHAIAQTAPSATALPTGGKVIAGQATIATTTAPGSASMTVTQGTKYGAIDWQSFNIGKNAAVAIQVPTSQSVSVNRVISPTSPSVIAGKLSSNGVVVVQNQSGVVFSQGAEVNVNTLIASAPGISDANARAGKLVFDQPANPGARVENHGTITVAQTGLAALVAPQVANSGVIRAQMGRVVLAGAEAHTVDLYGDGLLSIDVTKQVTQAPVGPDGKAATALVTNSGTIIADGGTILLTASAVDGLVQTLVTSGGTLRADTVGPARGSIAITAKGGDVVVSGTVAARGNAPGTKGGRIEINAPSRNVTLKAGAKVDASGKSGGGSVTVGTAMARGGGRITVKAPTARNVTIEAGARVAADATGAGNGGDVTVLSQGGVSEHRGELSARGGPQGGDGGFVELSGSRFVVGGRLDAGAPMGASGNILLDPFDLVISDAGATKIANNSNIFKTAVEDTATVISPAEIRDNMTGAITLLTDAGGTLTVSSPLDLTLQTSKGKESGITSLTLKSDGNMSINAAITGPDNITLVNTAGTLSITAAVTTADGKTITLNSAGSIALGADVNAGTKGIIDITAAAGGVTQSAGSLTAGVLQSAGGLAGGAKLNQATNNIVTLGAIAATAGNLSLATTSPLKVEGAVSVADDNTASIATPALSYGAAGSITLTGGSFELAPLTGAMTLDGTTATALSKVTAAAVQLGQAAGVTASKVELADSLDTSAFATTRIVAGTDGVALTKGTLKAAILDVTSGGAVADSALGTLDVATLQSTGGIAGNVVLDTVSHQVGKLGALVATGGTIALKTANALAVTGAVQADGIALTSAAAATATAIEVAGTGALTAKAGTVTLTTAADSGITLLGTIDAATLDLAPGTKGATQSGGTITAGTLVSKAGAAGAVALVRPFNAIASVGDLAVTGGGFTMASDTPVTISGALSAENVGIIGAAASGSAIVVASTGSITANGAAGVVTLTASDVLGGIKLAGDVSAKNGAIDLNAGSGGVAQTTGILTTPSLLSGLGIGGTVSLVNTGNAIASTGTIAVTGGDLLLASTKLDIKGTLSVGKDQTLSLGVDTLTFGGGTLSAPEGTVEIAPLAGGTAMSLGKAAAAELTLATADLAKIDSATLRLGAAQASPTIADSLAVRDGFDATGATTTLRLDAGGSGITVSDTVVLKAATLDLNTTGGGVTGVAGSKVLAITLRSSSGIVGGVALAEPGNAIATLGDMAVTGGVLALTTTLTLDIAGTVSSAGATIESTAAVANAITVSGALSGTAGSTIALSASNAAGGIALVGTVDATATGTLSLTGGTAGIIQAAGSVAAGTLAGGTTGNMTLAETGNKIAAIGDLSAGGNAKIASAVALDVSGTLSAGNLALGSSANKAAALTVSGTIKAATTARLATGDKAGGIALSGTVEAATFEFATGTGGVKQAGGSVLATTVQGDSTGGVALGSASNKIATTGALTLSGTGNLVVTSSAALKIAGSATVGTTSGISLTAESGTLTVEAPVTAPGGSIALRASGATGAIALDALVDAGAKGTIDLLAGSGGVSQSAGGLVAGTLSSTGGIGGTVALTAPGNAIGAIGGFKVDAGDFSLVATGPLAVTSPLAVAGTALLDITATSGTAIAVPSQITAANVTLVGRGAGGGISVGGSIATAGTLDISTTGGAGVAVAGSLAAGSLRSTLGIAGGFAAAGANAIAQIDAVTVTGGNFALANKTGAALAVVGPVEVDNGREIRIEADDATITGALTAPGGTITLRAPTAGISLGAVEPGELAVLQAGVDKMTADVLALVSTKAGITLRDSLDTTKAATLRLDTATGIAITKGTLAAKSLEVAVAAGGITQGVGVLAAAALTSGSGTITGTVTLDNVANAIDSLGTLSATGAITIASTVSLDIPATVTAPDISLTAGGAAGLNLAATGSLVLTGPGTVALRNTAALSTSTLAGTVNAAGGTLRLAGPGDFTQPSGKIVAATLTAPDGVGSVTLASPDNAIATLGTYTTGKTLALATSTALAVDGTVSAAGLALTAPGGITLSGTISAGDTIAFESGNGVTQTGGSLAAGKVVSVGVVTGPIALTQSNSIATLGDIAATGAITVVNGQALTIEGAVLAGDNTILSLAAPAMTLLPGGALTAKGGVVEIGPTKADARFGLGTVADHFALDSLANVTADIVRIGQASSTGNTNIAESIALAGTVGPNATTLQLITSGAITQTSGGLDIPVLNAAAQSIDLGQPGNTIGALGTLAITGDLRIASDTAIAVAGALSAATIALESADASAAALDISGSLSATGSIALTASNATGGIALSGDINATDKGTVDLSAGSAGIAQTNGSITAGTLQSTLGSAGAVLLDQGGNAIGALGGFAVSGASLTLRSATALAVTGAVSAADITLRAGGTGLLVDTTGSLTTGGTALLATNKDGGIDLAGTINALVLDLSAGTGGIEQKDGTIAAGTLRSTGGSAGLVSLGLSGNTITTLADFTVNGDAFILASDTALKVAGPLVADNVTLRGAAPVAAAIDVTGSIATGDGTITLSATNDAGGIALSGTLSTSASGAVDLSSGGKGIAQSAGTITTGTLRSATGTTGPVTLTQAANDIATLGTFTVTGAGFALTNAGTLAVKGAVEATGLALTSNAGAIAVDAGSALAAGTGTLRLQAVDAANGGLALAGTLSGAVVELAAGSKGIAQTDGSLAATTLRLNVADGSASLTRPGNAITSLGDSTITGGTLTLTTGGALAVSGVVTADAIGLTGNGATLALDATGSLATKGGPIALSAPSGAITLAGTIDATSAGSLTLSAGGNVSQTGGSITAGTLGDGTDGGIGGTLALAQPGNAIGAIGTLTVKGDATLASAVALDVAGTLSAANISLSGSAAAANALSVSGTATATGTMALATGATGGIALSGTLTAATLDLSAGSLGIAQTGGTIAAALLRSTGGATGAVTLDQDGNAIDALGAFAVTDKAFTLRSATALEITGAVSASTIAIRTTTANLTLGATGSLATPGTATLAAPAAGIVLAGTVDAATLDLSAGDGGITQTGGALVAATLLSTGGATGAVTLNQAGNAISNLGNFAVTGGVFTLRTAIALQVTGAVSATDIALTGDASLTLSGSGSLSAPGTVLLATPNGGMVFGGTITAGILDLATGPGGIKQTGGSIAASTLRATGILGGPVALAQPTNTIATLGDFAVSDTLALAGATALNVAGSVSATQIDLANSAAGTAIAVTGSIATAGTLALRTSHASSGIVLSGTASAGTLDLNAGKGGVAQPGGSITATTLLSSNGVGGTVSLDQAANAVTFLGGFSAGGLGFTLRDSISLTVTGAVAAPAITLRSTGASLALADTGSLASTGTTLLAALNGGIALAGTIDAATLDLSAGTGGITQPGGAITATTLQSTSGIEGATALDRPGNAIANLGNFAVTGGAFTLRDAIALKVNGAVSAPDIAITGDASLTLSGAASLTAPGTLELTMPNGGMIFGGTISAGTFDLSAGTGGAKQTGGSITAGTLLSTKGATGAVVLDRADNAIGALGSFDVTGAALTLRDSIALNVTGTVTAQSVSLRSSDGAANAITISGNLTATTDVALAATNTTGGISLSGGVSALTLDLSAGTAGVTQVAGLISAAELRSATGVSGTVTLDQPGNVINTIQAFKVTGGDFTLQSAASLGASELFANNIHLRTTTGFIGIQAPGVSTATGGTIRLDSATGIALVGSLNTGATGTVDLNAATNVEQVASSVITAGTLRSSTGVGINAFFGSDNKIGDLGDFKAGFGKFVLANSLPLTVSGTVSALDIAITGNAASAQAIDITGTLRTAAGRTIALAATAPGGGIALSGTVDATQTGFVDLQAGAGGITQTAGTITASTLQSNNGVLGSVVLDQPGNAIDVLGQFAVKAGNLSLASSRALTVAGPVDITAGDLALTSSATGPLALALTGPVTASGTARLAAPAGTLVLAGALKAGVLDLAAGAAGVTQTDGSIAADTLQSSGIGGAVSLARAGNTITKIGAFATDDGDIAVANATAIEVSGTLKASQGGVDLRSFTAINPAITVSGTVESGAGQPVTLGAPAGGILVTGQVIAPNGQATLDTALGIAATTGRIEAGKLSVSATNPAASVIITGSNNAIAMLSGATLAGGTFTLNNAIPLTITGPVSAPLFGITAGGSLKVADGVVLTTNGRPRADQGLDGFLTDAQINDFTPGDKASFLAVKAMPGIEPRIDTGSIAVAPFSVAQATLDLVLPTSAGGTISIGQLDGKTTDLILVTRTGGIATGTVDVAALLVVGTGGKSDLFGQIGGLDGQIAANKANITPRPDANYRFNACPITSVNCVLIPIQTIPPISPLRDVPIIRDRPTQDDTDVQLPNVSDEDY